MRTFQQWEPIKQLQEIKRSLPPLHNVDPFLYFFFLHRVNWQSKLEQVEIHHKYLNHLVKHNPHRLYFASNYCHMHVVKL